MDADELYARYRQLQAYVGWDARDAERVQAVASVLDPCLTSLIDDFYAEIERHPAARNAITGGEQQIERLKRSLIQWLEPLYSTKARGLGLGLALAKAIVERHQGSLRAASEQGKGSTFTVRLIAHVADKAGGI